MADQIAKAPITLCLSKATLAAGTTSTISTTGTTTYLIESFFYTKTAITNGATPTTDWVTGNAFIPIPIPLTSTGLPGGIPAAAAGYACAYTIGLDHSGNIKAIQGPIVGIDVNGNFMGAAPTLSPSLGPAGPNPGTIAGGVQANNDFCPIGFVVTKLGSAAVATWTFGTNNFSSVTGVTWSFNDIAALPEGGLSNLTYA
jgi:hypothetical protein